MAAGGKREARQKRGQLLACVGGVEESGIEAWPKPLNRGSKFGIPEPWQARHETSNAEPEDAAGVDEAAVLLAAPAENCALSRMMKMTQRPIAFRTHRFAFCNFAKTAMRAQEKRTLLRARQRMESRLMVL